MSVLDQIKQAVLECKSADVALLTEKALAEGTAANDIISGGLIEGIKQVGKRFGAGTYFLPELLVAGQSVQEAIDFLEPHIEVTDNKRAGKFLIGTVQGDIHDIGKNIVSMMLKCNGWDVVDAGVDVTKETFAQMINDGDFDVVGLSGLLTMTMPAIKATVEEIKKSANEVKVMVGGAPLTQEFADKIGADAFGKDAWDAVSKADALLNA